jgi:hypothetical protein
MIERTADFPHLRRADADTLAAIERLRAGEQLPIDPNPIYATALRLWAVERGIVQSWAREVKLGRRRQRCAEVERWSESVRRTWQVQSAWENTSP